MRLRWFVKDGERYADGTPWCYESEAGRITCAGSEPNWFGYFNGEDYPVEIGPFSTAKEAKCAMREVFKEKLKRNPIRSIVRGPLPAPFKIR